MERISKVNPEMKVVDTRRGINLLPMKTGNRKTSDRHAVNNMVGFKDPHIWMSLRLVKIQAQNICEALIKQDPANKDYYQNNLRTFIDDLADLDAEIIKRPGRYQGTKIYRFFYPAWGYFARDYGLDQIPVESEEKILAQGSLQISLEKDKKDGIKIIFVQKQFSEKSAEALADAIGGK